MREDELVDRKRSCVPQSGDWPGQGLRTRQDRRAALPAHTLERAMAVALVPREDNAFANDNPPPARNAVLARYRQLREISKKSIMTSSSSSQATPCCSRRADWAWHKEGR